MNNSRIDYLDFLRGVAITMVVIFHVGIHFQPSGSSVMSILKFGAHGVQLFFIVSAITMCVMWDARKGEANAVIKFYIRRILRIAPIFWLACFFYLLINPQWGDRDLFRQVFSTLTLTHGFSPLTNNAIVPGGWSIGVEVFFYLIFPFVFYFFNSNLKLFFFGVFCFVFFNLFLTDVLRWYWSGYVELIGAYKFEEYFYQSILAQLPVFIFGMIFYRIFVVQDRRHAWTVLVLFFLFFAVTLALKWETDFLARPFFWLFSFCLFCFSWFVYSKKIRCKAMSFVGQMSYSIYIFHFALIYFFNYIVPEELRGGWLGFFAWQIVIYGFSLGVAYISKVTLEEWSGRLSKRIVSKF